MRTFIITLHGRVEQMLTHTTRKPEPFHIVAFSVGSDNLNINAKIFFFRVLINFNYTNFLVL